MFANQVILLFIFNKRRIPCLLPQNLVGYVRFSDKLTMSLTDITRMIEEHKTRVDSIQEVALELTTSIGTLHTLTVKYAGIANNILGELLPIVKPLAHHSARYENALGKS
jgi:hypothetical protein